MVHAAGIFGEVLVSRKNKGSNPKVDSPWKTDMVLSCDVDVFRVFTQRPAVNFNPKTRATRFAYSRPYRLRHEAMEYQRRGVVRNPFILGPIPDDSGGGQDRCRGLVFHPSGNVWGSRRVIPPVLRDGGRHPRLMIPVVQYGEQCASIVSSTASVKEYSCIQRQPRPLSPSDLGGGRLRRET